MLSQKQAQRLLDFLYVPHRFGKPSEDARVIRVCRGCGVGGLTSHSPGCPLVDIIPLIEDLAAHTTPSRAELLAFVDEVHDWMHRVAVEKPDFFHRIPKRLP